MTVRVRHKTDLDAAIHDVTVVAFSAQGEEVGQAYIGDFPQNGRYEHTETITCEEFPAIITATAEETPCDGAQISLVYYVSESKPEEVADINDHMLWNGTWRECNEDIPPEWVLENVNQIDSTNRDE